MGRFLVFAVLGSVLCFSLLAHATETEPRPLPDIGRLTFTYKGTYFAANPGGNRVQWWGSGGLMGTFSDLPWAHDIWVNDEGGLLHVWIWTETEGVKVRVIELATGSVLYDLPPGAVGHGSHNCAGAEPQLGRWFRSDDRLDDDLRRAIDKWYRANFCPDPTVPCLGSPASRLQGISVAARDGATFSFSPGAGPQPDWVFFVLTDENNVTTQIVNVSGGGSITAGEDEIWSMVFSNKANFGEVDGEFEFTRTSPGTVVDHISLRLQPSTFSPLQGSGVVGKIVIDVDSGDPGEVGVGAFRIPNSGGHDEGSHLAHGGNNPPGRGPFIQFSRMATGPWLSGVTARRVGGGYEPVFVKVGDPGVSGTYQISAAAGSGDCDAHATTELTVKVPGLVELPPGREAGNTTAPYRRIGQEASHPKSHFGRPDFISGLQLLSAEVLEKESWVLEINDMSLEWGGLFDFSETWRPSHSEHRKGNDADVRYINIPAPKRAAIRRIVFRRFSDTLEHPIGGNVPPHWHVRQRP